ncbi:MAG: AAA family ATPase [Methanobrevibacter sp.]|jgi:DNA helicase-2/ATP-dependent DNA helicase PcrA|nr:AAA family ATPase [Methanobrevibacter sp.]
MVEKELNNSKLDNEVVKIFKHIKNEDNFLLSGGAGSGKTYSLIETIKEIFKQNPKSNIVCITYTKVATNEINERFSHDNLKVSTIHSFLWETIKQFDIPLKKSLLELINSEESKIRNPNNNGEEYFNEFNEGIDYKEVTNIDKGIISHDAVIELSEYMYKNYKLLCDIFKDKFDFVLIDEYQDTQKPVIEIFLNHLNKSDKKCIIGFFGDSMQSIYNNGVGDLKNYTNFKKVEKKQNRRNPLKVIELANKLREDGLKQESSMDSNAPNMNDGKVKQGSIKFLYSYEENYDINSLKQSKFFDNWDFETKNESKELYLTHKLISQNAKYSKLLEMYDKDNVFKLIKSIKKRINEDENQNINKKETFKSLIQKLQLNDKLDKLDMVEKGRYEIIKNESFDNIKSIKSRKEMLEKIEDMDEIMALLYKSISCLHFYKNKDYLNLMEVLNKHIKIDSVKKKNKIRNTLEMFNVNENKAINDLFHAFKDLFGQNDILKNIQNKYYFERIKDISFSEAKNLFYRIEEYSPYSTQHNVKGAEYKNVFVILDNGKWNQYNFECLLSDNAHASSENVLKRTRKLFYVSCTRTMENLIVFYQNPNDEILNNVKKLFGVENIHNL